MKIARRFAVASATLALAAGATLVGTSANAATTYSRTVTSTKWVSLSSIGTCAKVTMSATAKFTIATRAGGTLHVYDNRRLEKPRITVATFRNESGCSAVFPPTSVTKLTMTQRWYDYRCGGSLSMTAGLPWAVGVGGTYSCGSVKRATATTSYGSGSSFTHTGEDTISFSEETDYWVQPYGSRPIIYQDTCFRADATVIAYKGTSSASSTPTFTLCTRV